METEVTVTLWEKENLYNFSYVTAEKTKFIYAYISRRNFLW